MLSILQASRSRSVPVHLYRVSYGIGDSNTLRMTDGESPVLYEGQTYQPVQIKHGEIHASGSLDKTTLELSTRYDNPLAMLFRQYPPSQVVTITVLRGEAYDPDAEFRIVWSGRVLSCNTEVYESKFTCEPIGTAVRRPGLRRNYQYGCPHVLYGSACRANKAAVSRSVPTANVEGSTVRLDIGWAGALAPEKYISGIAEWVDYRGNPVSRTILRVNQDATAGFLLLSGTLDGLAPGVEITVAPGCNHQMNDCDEIFNNAPNHGGCPWIPIVNPVGSYNPFY